MTAPYKPPSFVESTLKAGIPFAVAMTLVFAIQHGGSSVALVAGPVSGLLFGGLLAVFLRRQSDRLVVRTPTLDGENIVHQGGANHWRGGEARGGWLVLTDRALVFRSHGVNVQNAGARIELANVRAVSPCNTLGVVPNGVRVDLADGTHERFVVSGRSEWLALLTARRAA